MISLPAGQKNINYISIKNKMIMCGMWGDCENVPAPGLKGSMFKHVTPRKEDDGDHLSTRVEA